MTAIIQQLFMDTSGRKNRSIICANGEHVLIPIHENLISKFDLRAQGLYKNSPSFDEVFVEFKGNNHLLAHLLPRNNISSEIMHDDPEFIGWTYGIVPKSPIVNTIINSFEVNDKIFIVSSMEIFKNRTIWAKYLVAVLVLESIFFRGFENKPDLLHILEDHPDYCFKIDDGVIYPVLDTNFHYQLRDNEYTGDLLIIKAKKNPDFKLEKPLRMTKWNSANGEVLPCFNHLGLRPIHMGYQNLNRAAEIELMLTFLNKDFENHPDFENGYYQLQLP